MEQSVYIFDADGVLNNLREYTPDDRILTHMAELLQKGTYVAINTGRGYDWVRDGIVQPVLSKLPDAKAMDRFFVSAEMGGLGIAFPGGVEHKARSAFSLTSGQIQQVHDVYDAHPEYFDQVHWYAKESMATLDKNDATPLDEFRPAQKALTDLLREVFQGQQVTVANSTDAVDVHAPEAGKRAGAELIYEWLHRTTDIEHDHFVCFGDSTVDYEMARFFADQSHDTVFVFTGLHFDGQHDANLKFVKTGRPYHDGTYEYLAHMPA